MLLNLGYSQVHRVEVYPQPTLSSHPASPWHILDLCASTSLGSLRNIKIDLLTDKGTLDFLLADLPPLAIHNYLHNLSALCASSQSGTLVLISFQSPSLIEKLFASVGFSIVSTSVVTDVNSSEEGQFTRDTNPGSGYHSKVLIYTMVPTTPPVPPTNEDEIRSILDAHSGPAPVFVVDGRLSLCSRLLLRVIAGALVHGPSMVESWLHCVRPLRGLQKQR